MGAATDTSGIAKSRIESLMELYQQDLLRMCAVYLRDRALAEDAVQETFIKAYRGIKGFRGDCSEKTWLIGIAINVCRNIRRGAWFRFTDRRVELERLPLPAPTADENSIAVTHEVMRLPSKEREVVLLHYYQGMKAKEAAQALGISGAAVSKRLKKARERLRAALERGSEE